MSPIPATIPSLVSSKLSERTRTLELVLKNFSKVERGQNFSYGATPFLVCNRKWGCNVYPFGLRPSGKDYGQRIDIYLHIWARDAHETEEQFLTWVRENRITFDITVTEPSPSALHVVKSSKVSWCDMEDAAGWWLITLRGCPRLMELTDDTLIIRIAFGQGEEEERIVKKKDEVAVPMGLVGSGSLPRGLFDNPTISDFRFVVGGKDIHVQRCVLEERVPNWGEIHEIDSDYLEIADVPYDSVYAMLAYAYTGTLPQTENSAKSYANMYILSERFGFDSLRRLSGRMIYNHLTPHDALEIYTAFTPLTPRLQELLCIYIIQNFSEIRHTESFRRFYSSSTKKAGGRLLALLKRMDTNAPHRPAIVSGEEAQNDKKGKLDWRRSMAFRSLLSNPEVSDVEFWVEGKVLTAQKCVLSMLSDYFLAMFSRGFQESSSNSKTVIHIPDFPHRTVHNMLLYLYTSSIDPPTSITDIGYLYVIADKYQIPDLVTKAKQLLSQYINAENVTEFLFGFAWKYEPLRKLVVEYLVADFNAVRRSEGFEGVVRRPGRWEDFGGCMGEIVEKIVVKDFEVLGWNGEVIEENGEEGEESECDETIVDSAEETGIFTPPHIEEEEEIFHTAVDTPHDSTGSPEKGKRHALDADSVMRPFDFESPLSPRRDSGDGINRKSVVRDEIGMFFENSAGDNYLRGEDQFYGLAYGDGGEERV